MSTIYILGDMHTVSAFRLAGVHGIVTDKDHAISSFAETAVRPDAGIILITRELRAMLGERVEQANLSAALPAVIEIPGIDDAEGFGPSILSSISDALGIHL
jgi:vacuolar-type H+-ATPase subunit F/Vma7